MFRFTIRDVLWLMVVVGMGAGWWSSERSWRAWKRTAEKLGFDQVNRLDNRIYDLETKLDELNAQQVKDRAATLSDP